MYGLIVGGSKGNRCVGQRPFAELPVNSITNSKKKAKLDKKKTFT